MKRDPARVDRILGLFSWVAVLGGLMWLVVTLSGAGRPLLGQAPDGDLLPAGVQRAAPSQPS